MELDQRVIVTVGDRPEMKGEVRVLCFHTHTHTHTLNVRKKDSIELWWSVCYVLVELPDVGSERM